MSETAVEPNNRLIRYRCGVTREKPRMPWDAQTIKTHNRSLGKAEAKSAARQANAILRETGNEGMALAVANKRINKLRNKGAISDRAHARMKHA